MRGWVQTQASSLWTWVEIRYRHLPQSSQTQLKKLQTKTRHRSPNVQQSQLQTIGLCAPNMASVSKPRRLLGTRLLRSQPHATHAICHAMPADAERGFRLCRIAHTQYTPWAPMGDRGKAIAEPGWRWRDTRATTPGIVMPSATEAWASVSGADAPTGMFPADDGPRPSSTSLRSVSP